MMDVNYKNQKRYKTAKYPIRQPWYLTWLIRILSGIMLANKKKTIEKWEQGANNINGSSAVLLKLLNDNPELLGQLYTVKVAEGKVEEEKYKPIDCKVVKVSTKTQKHTSSLPFPIAAIMMG